MLSNIIKQIQNEREQDKRIAKQIGTNQKHNLTNIPGHRKVTQNTLFKITPMNIESKAPVPEPPVPERPDAGNHGVLSSDTFGSAEQNTDAKVVTIQKHVGQHCQCHDQRKDQGQPAGRAAEVKSEVRHG